MTKTRLIGTSYCDTCVLIANDCLLLDTMSIILLFDGYGLRYYSTKSIQMNWIYISIWYWPFPPPTFSGVTFENPSRVNFHSIGTNLSFFLSRILHFFIITKTLWKGPGFFSLLIQLIMVT